jgi:hypothetical protein
MNATRRFFWCGLVLAFAMDGFAQSPATSYELRFTPSTQSPFAFPATSVTCNLVPSPAGASTVNPDKIEWTDTANAGRVCRYVAQPGDSLLGLPLGAWSAKLVAINAVGPSAESNAAPFSRDAAQSAPSGLRVIR